MLCYAQLDEDRGDVFDSRSTLAKTMTSTTETASSNPRGIPTAPFIQDVATFVNNNIDEVPPLIQKFQETLSKYRFMELNLIKRRQLLSSKLPDIQNSLAVLNYPKTVQFELNNQLYAKATVKDSQEVYLWLGANVMLAYTKDEAQVLLEEKLKATKKSLENVEEDLDFLKEQITVMEVNTARVHNWDVQERRKLLEKS